MNEPSSIPAIADAAKTLLQDSQHTQNEPARKNPPILFSKRFLIVVLTFLSYINATIIRNNINIAIVDMTSNKTTLRGNITITQLPEFDWDTNVIGLATSILWYGELIAFAGNSIVTKLGGSVSCSLCMMFSGITTFLHPITLYQNFYLLLLCRFLTGVIISIFTVSTAEIFARWIPKNERGTLISLTLNGMYVGTTVVNPFCGYLAYEWGWSMVFYVTGIISFVISILYLILVKNHPSKDNYIKEEELTYILAKTDNPKKKMTATTPYKSILSSPSVWALCISNLASSWILSTAVVSFPLFIKDITNKNTKDVGFISSIPNFCSIFTSPIIGYSMDQWKKRSKITTTRMHKITIAVAFISQMLLFILATFTTDIVVVIFYSILLRVLWPMNSLILQLITVSIAPQNTSAVAAITRVWFALGIIIARHVIGFMTVGRSVQEWNQCFLLTAVVLLIATVIYMCYGSSEARSWSSYPRHDSSIKSAK